MVFKEISQILSKYLFYLSLTLLFPLSFAIYFQYIGDPQEHPQPHSTFAFAATFCMSLALSFLLYGVGRKAKGELYRREGILVVVFIWFITSIVSALPFYFSGTLKPLDAYFETMSGLTTTGASVLSPKAYNPKTGEEAPIYVTNPQVPNVTYTYYGTVAPVRDEEGFILYSGVEAVSKAVLLWRSFLQWVGGLGIVVIFLTVLPALGVGGKFLYQIEITGPIKEEISPRIKETASTLWKLYFSLTLIEIFLLYWTNEKMPLFDAICTSMSNISTGGFSVRNDSIASYSSKITEAIVLVFMILGSINFAFYFYIIRLKFSKVSVPDFFLFLGTAALGTLLVSLYLIGYQENPAHTYSIGEAFRLGSFQALAAQTSTGFFIANYDPWPFPSQMFMLILIFVGGMSGSTAGGIKTSRFYILYKILQHRLESIYRPDSIRKLKIGDREIEEKNALTILGFFCIAAFFTVLGAVIYILDGIDPETSLGLIACFINNIGLAFRAAGPLDSFAFLSPLSKIFSTFWMLLGRLEFYIVLLLFLPNFWRGR